MKSSSPAGEHTPLGKIYLGASPGTPVGRFFFLVDPTHGVDVEVGSAVAADTEEGTLIGTVVDMRTIGFDSDPIRADLAGDWDAPRIGQIQPVMLAEVQVFSSDKMRPPRAGSVRAATSDEMLAATGYGRMDWPVPAGVVDLVGGQACPVYFDGEALLGPESQGCLVGGLSGQAAKTSYIGVLLKAALAAGSPENHSVAVLLFNVKGTDLIYLDQSPEAGYELSDDDLAMYEALGVPATPFDDVTIWSPGLPGGQGVHSAREDALPLRWGLRDVWENLRILDPGLIEDDNTSGFIYMFRDQLLNRPGSPIDTFGQLDAWFEKEILDAEAEERSTCWGSVHIATMRKLRRRFGRIQAMGRGLFTRGKTNARHDDLPIDGWRHGQVVVVDIAGLPTEVQGAVVARTIGRIMTSAEEGELGVDHLVVFADELNAFAPAQGGEMAQVRKACQKVATQGRYAGVSLFGAGQKLSKIDELVRDNAATRALGVTAEGELSSGVYGRLPAGLSERIATLPKGQMALTHYSFRQMLIVRFPRPAWRTGKAKTTGGAKANTVMGTLNPHLGAVSRQRLTEGIAPEIADAVIAAADDPVAAIDRLAAIREPDMTKTVVHAPRPSEPDDPFALDD